MTSDGRKVAVVGGVFAAFVAGFLAFRKWLLAPEGKAPPALPSPASWDRPAEGFAPLQPASTCDPSPKPGVVSFRDWTLAHFGGYDAGIPRDCKSGGTSEHKEGRAWDWGISSYKGKSAVPVETIEGFLHALISDGDAELARRAGIMYVIYNRRIWSAARHAEGWRPYSGPSPHTDHVHFSFSWPGARGETSFYERQAKS